MINGGGRECRWVREHAIQWVTFVFLVEWMYFGWKPYAPREQNYISNDWILQFALNIWKCTTPKNVHRLLLFFWLRRFIIQNIVCSFLPVRFHFSQIWWKFSLWKYKKNWSRIVWAHGAHTHRAARVHLNKFYLNHSCTWNKNMAMNNRDRNKYAHIIWMIWIFKWHTFILVNWIKLFFLRPHLCFAVLCFLWSRKFLSCFFFRKLN